jgi:hypothetical protein
MQKPPHQKSYTFLKHIPKRKVLAFHSIPKLEKERERERCSHLIRVSSQPFKG